MKFPVGPYNPHDTEKALYEEWLVKGVFTADPTSKKPHYSILMPPPNLTGELHLGHALQHSILDAIARFKKLRPTVKRAFRFADQFFLKGP